MCTYYSNSVGETGLDTKAGEIIKSIDYSQHSEEIDQLADRQGLWSINCLIKEVQKWVVSTEA